MRLDKYLAHAANLSRKDAAGAIRSGQVQVNGRPERTPDAQVDPDSDRVFLHGLPVLYKAFHYYLVHKPRGVVSVTEDRLHGEKTVLDLLPDGVPRRNLFPCGRLDKNTTGLLLLTDDGRTGHALLSPARHIEKEYAFEVKFPLSEEDRAALCAGVDIGEEKPTRPCTVTLNGERSGTIVLTEGKYHQIKRMMEAVHNQIVSLCRIRFGPLCLEPGFEPGMIRPLSDFEVEMLQNCVRSKEEKNDESQNHPGK